MSFILAISCVLVSLLLYNAELYHISILSSLLLAISIVLLELIVVKCQAVPRGDNDVGWGLLLKATFNHPAD